LYLAAMGAKQFLLARASETPVEAAA